jgi:hypothetical protein
MFSAKRPTVVPRVDEPAAAEAKAQLLRGRALLGSGQDTCVAHAQPQLNTHGGVLGRAGHMYTYSALL